MSTSVDGTIRQWMREGEPVGKSWNSDGETEGPMAVSSDEQMVVSGSIDGRLPLEYKGGQRGWRAVGGA
jgi:hypothetical protein